MNLHEKILEIAHELEEQQKSLQETESDLRLINDRNAKLDAELQRLYSEKTQIEIERDSLKEKVKQREEKIEAERSEAAKLKDALEARLAEAERKLGLQENDLSKVTQERDSLIVLLRGSRRISEEVRARMAALDEKAAELHSKKREFVARLMELDAKVAELDR